jgi:hypothetical protein
VSRAGHAGNHRPEDFSDRPRWRREAYRIIFEHDTPAGLAFDILLIVAIITSVVVVMLESVAEVQARHGALLRTLEWVFTILFTGEYALRIASARSATRYARSFYGVIDFLAILPTYLSIILPGGQAFAVIRILRVLRVFRVLKLAQYVGSERVLLSALRASAHKITVFLIAVLTLVMVLLGYRHGDHRRLRRYRAADRVRTDPGGGAHDHGVRHHRGTHGDRYGPARVPDRGGVREGSDREDASGCRLVAPTAAARLYAVRRRASRFGCDPLQILWRRAARA